MRDVDPRRRSRTATPEHTRRTCARRTREARRPVGAYRHRPSAKSSSCPTRYVKCSTRSPLAQCPPRARRSSACASLSAPRPALRPRASRCRLRSLVILAIPPGVGEHRQHDDRCSAPCGPCISSQTVEPNARAATMTVHPIKPTVQAARTVSRTRRSTSVASSDEQRQPRQ